MSVTHVLRHVCAVSIVAAIVAWPTGVLAQEPSPATEGTEPAPAPIETWDESDSPDAPPPTPTTAPAPVLQPTGADPTVDEELRWRRKKHNHYRSMMISGWTTLGVAYGASVLVGAIAVDLGRDQDDDRKVRYGSRMFIPIGGPIAAAVESRSVTLALVTAGASVAQIVGLALGTTGTVKMKRYPNPDERSFAFAVMPSRRGAQAGLTLRF